jgi:hypothetical protein
MRSTGDRSSNQLMKLMVNSNCSCIKYLQEEQSIWRYDQQTSGQEL